VLEPEPSISQPETALLRSFLGIDEEEDARLRAFAAREIPDADRRAFVDAFYDHLGAFDEPKRILAEPGRQARLRESLAAYLNGLFTQPIDDAYLRERTAIGRTHLRIGLYPRWYLGAYAFFVGWWIPRLDRGAGGPARARAFLKRILLDALLAMEAYVGARVEHLARELVESERKYEDLVENAPEMIHQVSEDGRFIGVNRTELARLGYTLEEMRSMRLEEVVPPALRHGMREYIERVRREGSSAVETVFRTKAGEEFPVEIFATAQYASDGSFVQTRAFVRDLSERRRLERELVRWERLATVGSMAAKVAHEIRNPLSAISLNAELLEDEVAALPGARQAEGKRLLETILGGVDRLNAVIEEYLTFARLPRLTLEDVSIPEILYRLEQLLAPELEVKGIRLVVEMEETLPAVAGDRRQLEQALINVLRNAEEAMPDGGEVRVRVRGAPRGLELSILDTGSGIPEESLPLIFDPFFTTKDSGTGLGLAYVQQVLREHRATIVCRSRLGEGTEFVITLPTADRAKAGAGRGEDRGRP
jgi:PAS domain S-box-containing protein